MDKYEREYRDKVWDRLYKVNHPNAHEGGVMTDKEWLDEVRKRCDAATEGPWNNAHGLGVNNWPDSTPEPEDLVEWYPNCQKSDEQVANDAEFISHARTDIPCLLAEIERLKNVVRGCLDYGGGYSGADYAIYQHGIQTVINAIEAGQDSQTEALRQIGARSKALKGEK